MLDALKREIREETGYYDFKSIDQLGDPIEVDFFHWSKNINYLNKEQIFLIDLASLKQQEVVEKECNKHEMKWFSSEKVMSNIHPFGTHNLYRNRYLYYPLEDYTTVDDKYIQTVPTYRRECDTLDTFMCSSFYFLRYPDADNPDQLSDPILLNKCFPVDLYIGGKEHTFGHLLYARFIHKFLYDQGYLSSVEPFQKLVHQGMVMGSDGRKMSKRRNNVIDPIEVIQRYGSDAVRTYLLFM